MVTLSVAIYLLLTLLAGAAVAGLIALELQLEERLLLSVVLGITFSAVGTYFLALVAHLTWITVLAGPLLVGAVVALGHALGAPWPQLAWVTSWQEAKVRWRTNPRWGLLLFGLAATGFFWWIMGRALVPDAAGNLMAGYQTVWADWSQHLTTQASFAYSANIPPQNPIFSGTTLLYPFMPDFHSAELVVLGMNQASALALPGGVLAVSICLLLVCVAARLGIPPAAGGIAAVISVLGGGLGFARAFGDACVYSKVGSITPGSVQGSPYDVASAHTVGCDLHHLATTPSLWGAVLHNIGTVVTNQPRAYDGLLTDYQRLAVHNLQWPTPLMGWWLPQRSFIYGCAIVLAVILIIAVALRSEISDPLAWGVAAAAAGLLPLFHVHSLIALVVILAVVAVFNRRRQWLTFVATLAVVAGPRFAQLALGPHGDAADGNQYPSILVGWRYHFDPAQPQAGGEISPHVGIADVVSHGIHVVSLPLRPDWWSFWVTNLGIALPLCAAVLLMWLTSRAHNRAGAAARTLLAPFSPGLLPWIAGSALLFMIANVVVFQTWDWDNTKIFAYWYLFAGLLIGAVAVHLMRHRLWAIVGVLLIAVTVASGALVVFRISSWETADSRSQVAGPYTLVRASDVKVAEQLRRVTPNDAVFITSERPQDAVSTLTGRPAVFGYGGWLWSYGLILDGRSADVTTVLQGCGQYLLADSHCAITSILRRYHVSYVEVDGRGDGLGVQGVDVQWWAQQGLPVVAHADDTNLSVYDVSHITG